jgi:hypothetical protein
LLCAACHDAPRNNPFDPALTPAVEVQAALDDTAGAVALTWGRYQGQEPFAGYRVLRKVRGLEAVDTLEVITQPELTFFVDDTLEPDLEYHYWVEVLNQAGFASPSIQVAVRSFAVKGVELLEVQGDGHQGVIALRWQRYRGPNFTGYRLWRRRFGEESRVLATLSAVDDTAWSDTTPLPAKEYLYWIEVLAAGRSLESQQVEGVYALPPLDLLRLVFDSDMATAAMSWTEYEGPRFGGYEVHRRTAGAAEGVIAEIADKSRTSFTDSLLDGNTEYAYRIGVRTTWEEERVEAFTPERSGLFYGLREVRPLPGLANAEVQALSLALDEQDRLYVAASAISTTTARVMQQGIKLMTPGQATAYTAVFNEVTPDRLSPVHLAVRQNRVYLTVKTDQGEVLVGAVEADTRRSAWSQRVDTGGAFPVGIHAEEDGSALMVDAQGVIYSFSAEGVAAEPSDKLQTTLQNDQALPIRHLVVGRAAGLGGSDQFFLVAPERDNHHLVGRTRLSGALFGGRPTFDDGVGPGNGETLNPLVLAFDPLHTRLVVLEAQGRLQVFNAEAGEAARRYLTKWGRFGRGEGEFQVSPPTAVALGVDSEGKIYVVDGEERVQVFAP